MPELPEIETVCRGLAPYLRRAECCSVTCRRQGLRYPFPHNVHGLLKGATVLDITRRGKYLCLHFDNAYTLILHLGMSGSLRLLLPDEDDNVTPGKHDHFIMHFGDDGRLVFNDPRRFGAVYLTPTNDMAVHPALKAMGPEPLAPDFDASVLAARLKGRKAPVKNLLLDQHIVAGLGNIYICEALYEAGIHPRRPAGDIDVAECEALCGAIVRVLDRAVDAGGTSLRDHKRVDGTIGYFQHQFRVYQREGEPCMYCDEKEHTHIICQRIANRATYFCPNHQR